MASTKFGLDCKPGARKISRKSSLFKMIALLFSFCTIYYLLSFLISVFKANAAFSSLKDVIRPPKLGQEQFNESLKIVGEHIARNEYQLASDHVSNILQDQIRQIQEMDCDQPNLKCGNQMSCGLGCHMHHSVACLIMSYATNLPLIHTPDSDAWQFTDRWADIFEPLGSKCAPGNNTVVWNWEGQFEDDYYLDDVNLLEPYALKYGIPLDSKLAELIEAFSSDSFRWVVGQFVKYAMKLNTGFKLKLIKWKKEIWFDNLKRPIAGIAVRRTDKIYETPDSHHPISMYMDEVEKYYQGLEKFRGLDNNSLPRRVFVASDDSYILEETEEKYPNWGIFGFTSKLQETHKDRRNGLFEIVRDIEFLFQMDFVVCALSSNVCRLIYEMQATEIRDKENEDGEWQPETRLKSLDGAYNYRLEYHNIDMRIWKIDF